jgi:hypothetical protein
VSIQQQNKFNFFVETDIKKGKGEKGEDVIIIDGIASTSKVADSDKETLFPIGFNLQPFLESGLVNFNHQGSKDSNANIGIPLEAKVINKGQDLYVKCMLFPCPQTDGIVRMYENFKKYSPNRKVGFSIEGKATQRDVFDQKKILAADISGLAVTFSPKNKNTLMNIVKGEYQDAFIPVEDEEDDEKEKAVTTETIAPATPESVEHKPKNINNLVSNNNITNFEKDLKKSDIFISIAQRFPFATIAQQKTIYKLVEETSNKIFKMEVVTPESLQKAFDIINEASVILKGEKPADVVSATDDLNKAEGSEDAPDEAEVEKAMGTANCLYKAGMEKDAACDTMCKGGIAMNVAQGAWEKVISEANANKEGDQNTGTPASTPIFKSEDFQNEIKKSLDPISAQIGGVKDIVLSAFGAYDTIIKSLQADGEAAKNLITKANETNAALLERLEKVEKTPVPTKSLTSAAALERFAKSEDADAGTKNENTFDVTNKADLKSLSDRLFEHIQINNIQKGEAPDPLLEGAINSIEINGVVPSYSYARLAAMGIKLVKP